MAADTQTPSPNLVARARQRMSLLLQEAMADNARLTQELAEAEGERDAAFGDLDRCHVLFAKANIADSTWCASDRLLLTIDKVRRAEANAATGRAVALRARDGWLPWGTKTNRPFWVRRNLIGEQVEPMLPEHAAYIASSDEPT